MVAEVKAILCAAAELDRFDRDVSIHFNASHAENVDAYETASPLTANQLAALQALGRRCAQEQGHQRQVSPENHFFTAHRGQRRSNGSDSTTTVDHHTFLLCLTICFFNGWGSGSAFNFPPGSGSGKEKNGRNSA